MSRQNSLKISSGKVILPFLLAVMPFAATLNLGGDRKPVAVKAEIESHAALSPAKIANACKAYRKFKSTGKKTKLKLSKSQLKIERKNKKSKYDVEGDYLTSAVEAKIKSNRLKKDSDKDGLTDSQELCDTQTDPTDPDSDGDGILDGADPDSDAGGGNDTLCTDNGDTAGFGILPGLTGNISRGADRYNSTCLGCHAAAQGIKGSHLQYAALNSAISGFPMFLSLPAADVADLTAYVNADLCTAATPTPTPPPPGSTPTASPTPPPSSGQCDSNGNTTSFEIPAPLIGNIAAGQAQYQSTCSGCHPSDKGINYLYPALKSAINGSPMFITNLSNQQIANIVAYLNRYNCSGNGTPSPTPPQTPAEIGHELFISMCSSCHSHGEHDWTQSKIQHAFNDEDEMQELPWRPTTQQYYYLVQYFLTLGGGDD